MRKTRLVSKDLTRKDKDEIAWSSFRKGFDLPATRLYTVDWSASEVLPFQAGQVWNESPVWRSDPLRIVMGLIALVTMIQMIYRLICKLTRDTEDSTQKSARRQVFERKFKTKMDMLRFEFNAE